MSPSGSTLLPRTGRPLRRSTRRSPIGSRHGTRLVITTLILLTLLTACIATNPTGQEIKNKGEREPPNREFLNGTVAANNAFGADLYRALTGNRGNYAYSPYAVLTALAMARAGSSGETRAQLDAVLHAALATNLDAGLNTVQSRMGDRVGEKKSNTRKGKVSLQITTSLWGQRGTHVKDEFLNVLVRQYGTGFRVTDFRSDPETSRQAVNNWATDATSGQIEELVARGDVTQHTRFLPVAAAHLEAPWQLPFDSEKTRTEPFGRPGEPPVDVRMMQLVAAAGLRYAEGDDWQAVELPYLGDELELDVVMPAVGRFEIFEQALTSERLREITSALEPRSLDVRLPQFQFTTADELHETLATMGIPDAFSRTADFSGITSDEVLSLSGVVYKGFFGIGEEGTNPQPNTATLRPGQDPSPAGAKTVVIDRPFIFFVRDRDTGLILFIGRVVNPG